MDNEGQNSQNEQRRIEKMRNEEVGLPNCEMKRKVARNPNP